MSNVAELDSVAVVQEKPKAKEKPEISPVVREIALKHSIIMAADNVDMPALKELVDEYFDNVRPTLPKREQKLLDPRMQVGHHTVQGSERVASNLRVSSKLHAVHASGDDVGNSPHN